MDYVEEISQGLFAYVNEQYQTVFGEVPPEGRPWLGFYIAGYSPAAPFPEEFEFVLRETPSRLPRGTSRVSARVGGA